MNQKESFWKGKRVLVTGHTGFVGSWLCTVLKNFGADITGFALKEESGSLYERIKIELGINSVYADLRNIDDVRQCIQQVKPDTIFHIAAVAFLKDCFLDPERAYTSNVNGTINLFQAINEYGEKCRIVVASSDKVYRNVNQKMYLFKEEDPLGGSDTYSASKTCEDIIAQSFFDSYLFNKSMSLCIVRPSNIIGGGDGSTTRLIPSLYFNFSHGLEPEIRNPDSVRPWQNILDIVDAYLTLAEYCEEGCSIFNVGPELDGIKTVGEIVEYVRRLYRKKEKVAIKDISFDSDEKMYSSNQVKEKIYLGLSIDKIKKDVGWSPKRTLEESLDEIYEFYELDKEENIYRICQKQIERYYGGM